MARDHARLATSIWQDADFLALGPHAQRMYMLILAQPALSYAGTITFTARRWATLSAGTDRDAVEKAIHELEDARFLVVDWELDELLVRSFVRNDGGLLDQPNMAIAARKAADEILSPYIRQALADDLHRHRDAHRQRKGWAEIEGWVDAHRNPSPNPSTTPSQDPSRGVTPPPAPAPAPSPTPMAGPRDEAHDAAPPPAARKRASQLPDGWAPNDGHHELARAERVDLARELAKFRDHHVAKGNTFKDWDRAFANWLRRAGEYAAGRPATASGPRDDTRPVIV